MSSKAQIRIGRRLNTIGGCISEMARVYRHCRRGELDTLDGTRLVNMLREIRVALEMGELERRLEALETRR